MKAIVWTKYGPPEGLELQEIETPIPKGHEILVKVRATTVTAGDCEMRSLKVPLMLGLPIRIYAGLLKPTRITVLGQEFSGEIESVGKDVTRFKKGNRVFGTTGFGSGTYAEYICLPENPGDMDGPVATVPANMTFEEAAAVPTGGLEALHHLGKGDIQSGESVLVNGAGGSIGTIAVQYAKHLGAEVTAVDSTEKLDMLLSLGADHVVDFTQEDFTTRGEAYDVILDVVGKSPFARSVRSLEPHGRYLLANPRFSHMLRGLWTSRRGNKKVLFGTASSTVEDLIHLRSLIEAGTIKAVIGRRFPLEQVADAHRYVESGRKQGSVVITVDHGG